MRGIPTRQRQRADRRTALEHGSHRVTGNRRQPRNVDRHDRRPIGALVPGQQVSGQREGEHEPQERQAREPCDLPRRLVRTEDDDAQQMKDQEHDEKARAEMMEPTDEASGRRAADEAHAFVGVVGRGCVVEREERAREQLDRDQAEEHAAECERPSGAGGYLLIEQRMARRAETRPRVEPLQEPGRHAAAHHTRTSTVSSVPSTRASIVVSGRGGGPSSTWPLTS